MNSTEKSTTALDSGTNMPARRREGASHDAGSALQKSGGGNGAAPRNDLLDIPEFLLNKQRQIDFDVTIRTPAARSTDPETSHLAADHMNASGNRDGQNAKALDLVRRYPNHTAQELARYGVLDRLQLARRLADLETGRHIEKGTARNCTVTGRKAHTWHIK